MTRDDLTFVVLVMHRLWERCNVDAGCPFCDRWAIEGCHAQTCRYLQALDILETEGPRLEDPIMF